jgi:hypothetical protein
MICQYILKEEEEDNNSFSTAGGKNIDGLSKVISIGKKMILQKVSV